MEYEVCLVLLLILFDKQKIVEVLQRVSFGVPQCLVLGLILFLMFINYLFFGLFKSNTVSFADDSALSDSDIDNNQLD